MNSKLRRPLHPAREPRKRLFYAKLRAEERKRKAEFRKVMAKLNDPGKMRLEKPLDGS